MVRRPQIIYAPTHVLVGMCFAAFAERHITRAAQKAEIEKMALRVFGHRFVVDAGGALQVLLRRTARRPRVILDLMCTATNTENQRRSTAQQSTKQRVSRNEWLSG
jgi:hypothetical protein